MDELWEEMLPQEYRNRIVRPIAFEHHTEPSVSANKIIGFDVCGKRCFYFHSFLLTEEGFDIDEFPISIDVYYERVIAWRLNQGSWINIKSYSDRLDKCQRRLTTLPLEMTATAPR
ncbi:MAG: hypothetical protein HOP04_03365 [Methylophilaceae bacterium]|nr:hypothetical protein [Methylophilaceae bacterium]